MKFSAGEKFFLDPYQLRDVLDQHRERGEKIVFANGCFELLHVGHIRYLRGAKALGQVLVVAVNTDASMKIIKPERQPPNPDTERYEILAALEMVDYVVPLSERTPTDLIGLLRPDVHTKGTDYRDRPIPESEIVEAYGGRVALGGDEKNHSTTDILRKLRSSKLTS